MANTPTFPVEAGSDIDQLLRCLLTLNINHHDRMPLPVTAYVLDWQPTPGLPTGGLPAVRLHAQAEQFTDWPQLDAYAEQLQSGPGESGTLPFPEDFTAHAVVPHRRLGAALVVEIDGMPEFDDQFVRQVQARDISGTLISIIQTESGPGPRWWVKPHDDPEYGDPAAAIDYATVRPQLDILAWAHIHGITQH